jgi:hypothetical protein
LAKILNMVEFVQPSIVTIEVWPEFQDAIDRFSFHDSPEPRYGAGGFGLNLADNWLVGMPVVMAVEWA